MPQYIGVGNVAREVSSQYIGVSSVSRQVVGGYIGVSGVARKFFPSGASAITNFKKTSKAYNNIYFSWTNPSSNYTGIRIQAKTGTYPTSTSDGTNVYHGVGTNTKAGATNTSGKVSLTISSRTATTYYFSVWSYLISNGTTYYSPSPIKTDAALVCHNCGVNCWDCCDGDCSSVCNETVCSCDTYYKCSCNSVDRCRPWDKANDDCGSVWFETIECEQSKPGSEYNCRECDTCGDCVNYPSCGDVTY